MSRREVLAGGAAAVAALALARCVPGGETVEESGFGPLRADPGGLVDLPRGFQYRVLSTVGTPMSDGHPTPGDPDGMAAFRGRDGRTTLVRNHEIGPADDGIPGVPGTNPYDRQGRGGTTALVVDSERRLVDDRVASSGTVNNCAGGRTPWGTWLTCEETHSEGHGYVFEVVPGDPENALSRTPITEMGWFSHEALGVDPRSGFVYLTEDDLPGGAKVAYLYRFRPNRTGFAGALQQGGVLEALAIESLRTPARRTADAWETGQTFGAVWKRVDPREAHASAERAGCVRFNRLEGACFDSGALWFDDTGGGEAGLGQIFRYVPARRSLELFLEGTNSNVMEAPDNMVVTPWGHLWFCEDGPGFNRVVGVEPSGSTYEFARVEGSELAGATFSPDGRTFFLNLQAKGLTLAIWGPFRERGADASALAVAAPPPRYAPRVGDELAEAAERYGLSTLEAAAYDRLGVVLT